MERGGGGRGGNPGFLQIYIPVEPSFENSPFQHACKPDVSLKKQNLLKGKPQLLKAVKIKRLTNVQGMRTYFYNVIYITKYYFLMTLLYYPLLLNWFSYEGN